jgi:hypothetical protein
MPDYRPVSIKEFIYKTHKLIETIFSLLTEIFDIHRIKARHIYSVSSKILSKFLAHNFYTLFKS